MKSLSFPRSFSLILLVGALSFVSGCSANLNMPDTQETSDFGNLQGGVYGGHAPITAAQVYIFETPTSTAAGYGDTAPISLIGHTGSSVTCNASVAFPIIYNSTTGLCSYQTGGYNGGVPPTNNIPAGQFNLSGIYKCDIGQNVWLYSVGGYPDQGSQDFNPYITLMADLGPCPAVAGDPTGTGDFSGDSYIYMNELSTMAMAYALAPFTGDTSVVSNTGINTKISAPPSNSVGLTNAFKNAGQLYDISGKYDDYSVAPRSAPRTTPYGTHNGVPPYILMNTMGNALAACVDSTMNSAPIVPPATSSISTSCTALFADVYNLSTPPDTDTASAAFYIAQNPTGTNTANLLNLALTSTAWAPALSGTGTFHDLSASIAYSGVTTPEGMVTDAIGNAFTADYTTSGYVQSLSPLGVVTTDSTLTPHIANAATLSIDKNGLIWTPGDTNPSTTGDGAIWYTGYTTNPTSFTSVTKITGTPLGGHGQIDPIATDGTYVYISDETLNEIYKISSTSSATTIKNGQTGHGCMTGVTDVAVDGAGFLWVTSGANSTGNDNVCRIGSTGSFNHGVAAGGRISSADAVAVDSNNNAWVLDENNANLHKVSSSGVVSPTSGSYGSYSGSASGPFAVTVDGAGDVWTLNDNGTYGSLTELSNAGVLLSNATYGFQYGNFIQPEGFSIDISGDIWVANYGGGSTGNVVEVIGIAAPTKPYSAALPGTLP